MPDNQFTWIPLYKELAKKLLGWEDRQGELIALIETMRADNLTVTTMTDRDANDNPFLMKEEPCLLYRPTKHTGLLVRIGRVVIQVINPLDFLWMVSGKTDTRINTWIKSSRCKLAIASRSNPRILKGTICRSTRKETLFQRC